MGDIPYIYTFVHSSIASLSLFSWVVQTNIQPLPSALSSFLFPFHDRGFCLILTDGRIGHGSVSRQNDYGKRYGGQVGKEEKEKTSLIQNEKLLNGTRSMVILYISHCCTTIHRIYTRTCDFI